MTDWWVCYTANKIGRGFPNLKVEKDDLRGCRLEMMYRKSLEQFKLQGLLCWITIGVPDEKENRQVDIRLSVQSPKEDQWNMMDCLDSERWNEMVKVLFEDLGLGRILPWIEEHGEGVYLT